MKELRWTDVNEIAIELVEKYPDINPSEVRFTDLHQYVCTLENFTDNPQHSSERILEAIQMAWLQEVE